MLVLLDIGNTRTKYCFVNQGKRSPQQAILNQSISNAFLCENFSSVLKVVVASVSNTAATDQINAWCLGNNIVYQQVYSEIKKNKIVSGYEDPNQLGVDRWLALIGAARLYPNKNLLIIDAGTATTIDFLLASGQHQGGWILAGVKLLISSVLSETTQVKANLEEKESLAFGFNTSENVHNAAWAATIGAIHLAISKIENQGLILDEVIITGGNGDSLAQLITHKSTVISELVFNGIEAYI
ncbi:type III pantothenate kinase [Colwellia sp. 20A7]|uniref:type III pantothenate kinase n=1 Tax=Colwellia sp. 20A7 TaxID=2689569 RepID=UPI00135BB97B|nr:type III pantothenate kinase [Colwellia sp. 20A7]